MVFTSASHWLGTVDCVNTNHDHTEEIEFVRDFYTAQVNRLVEAGREELISDLADDYDAVLRELAAHGKLAA